MSSTVNEVYAHYCRTQVDLTPSTLEHTLWALNLLCQFCIGHGDQDPTTLVNIDQINRDTIEDWRAWLVEQRGPEGRPRFKRNTIRSVMAAAAPVFRWAANREVPLIQRNPFVGAALPKARTVVVVFNQDEIDRMLKVANLRWQGMIRVAITAGAERSLVQNLVWDDFCRLEEGLIRVSPKADDVAGGTWQWQRKRRGVQGGQRIQWLPVSDHMQNILPLLRTALHLKQPYPFVPGPRYWELRSRIGGMSQSLRNSPDPNFAGMFNRIMELAKIPKVVNGQSRSWHNLRATFATNALHNGVSLKTVQGLMGHASPKMTMEYYEAEDPAGCEKTRAVAMA